MARFNILSELFSYVVTTNPTRLWFSSIKRTLGFIPKEYSVIDDLTLKAIFCSSETCLRWAW